MDMESRRDGCGVESFRAFGFAVLRQFFDPGPLAMEWTAFCPTGCSGNGGATEISETPASLSLLDRLGAVAETLFERPVLPTREKGTRYETTLP